MIWLSRKLEGMALSLWWNECVKLCILDIAFPGIFISLTLPCWLNNVDPNTNRPFCSVTLPFFIITVTSPVTLILKYFITAHLSIRNLGAKSSFDSISRSEIAFLNTNHGLTLCYCLHLAVIVFSVRSKFGGRYVKMFSSCLCFISSLLQKEILNVIIIWKCRLRNGVHFVSASMC